MVRAEVDITEKITAYATIGAHDYRAQRLAGGTNITALNFSGNATTSSSTFSQYQTYQTGEAGLRALVNTGPIDHEFAFSATGFQQETGAVTVTGAAYNTNIYNPEHHRPAQHSHRRGQQDQLRDAFEPGVCRHAVGGQQAHPAHRWRPPAEGHGDQLQPDHRRVDRQLRPERLHAGGRVDLQALGERLALRQLHPGPAPGRRRRLDLRQRRRGLSALQVDAVRGRREGRLGSLHDDAQPVPDHAAQHDHRRGEQHAGAGRRAAQPGTWSSMSSASRWRVCACWVDSCC